MPFLLSHPAVAWFLPAVSLPVLFHMFFRLRRQVREFPSLMFFQRIDPRLSAKRKIHEWLILFLRCLFIALVVLALTRPKFESGSGGTVARLVLIDNSASMAGPSREGVSKLALALRAAEKLRASAKPGDATALRLMIPDPMASLPGGFNPDPAALRDVLGKITPSDGAANVPKAIRLALAELDAVKQPVRELHILTDLQKNHWSRGELEAQAGRDVRIVIHRIDSPRPTGGWVSLAALETPNRSLPAGRVVSARVTLRNNGPAGALIRLNTTDDTGKNASRNISVPAGEAVPLTLSFSFATAGIHWARAWLEGDAAPGADRIELGFWCSDSRKALFVGNKEKFAALPYAVAPGGNADLSGIDAVAVEPGKLSQELFTNPRPLAVALAWEDWPQDVATAKALENYVRSGGMLFLVPAPDTGVSIGQSPASWVDASAQVLREAKEPEQVMALQTGDSIWRNLRDSDGKLNLGALRAIHYRPLKIGKDWQPLLLASSGPVLFARRPLGLGLIFASGVAFTQRWSSLPLKPGFVVLIQNAFFGEQAEAIPLQSIHAGEDLRFDDAKMQAVVRSLAGNAVDWHGTPQEFQGLPRAGIVEVSQNNKTKWAAVSASAEEAVQEFLGKKTVPLLKNARHEVVDLTGEGGLALNPLAEIGNSFLYGTLLAAALLVLAAETILANARGGFLGRKLMESLKLPARLKLGKKEEAVLRP